MQDIEVKMESFKFLSSTCQSIDDHQKRGEIIKQMIAISKDIVADTYHILNKVNDTKTVQRITNGSNATKRVNLKG